jgi:hypothetical protein
MCPIRRPPAQSQALFYSGKFKRHCLKYELAVSLNPVVPVFVSGSFPGSYHDARISRQGGMLNLVEVDELILGDKAYVGVPHFVFPIRDAADAEQLELNRRISSVRIKVEHLIRRIRTFDFSNVETRHDLNDHAVFMYALIEFVRIDLRFRPVDSS